MKELLNRSVWLLSAIFCGCMSMQAQQVCTIKGSLGNDSLRYTPERVKMVYLTTMDECDRPVTLDSAKVKKNKFTFKYKMKEGDPILMHFISGFDNGSTPLVVEPGVVNVEIKKAAYPVGAKVWGTKNNDLYAEYSAIGARCTQSQSEALKLLIEKHGEQWIDSDEGWKVRYRVGASALITCTEERIKFLLDHNDCPLTPLLMEREISYMLSNTYAEMLLNSISPTLHNHPYYRAFSNTVRALDLRVGGELPDIRIPLRDGTSKYLSDFKGKYVLLDFWASWCGPCLKELPHLKKIYDDTRANKDKFVIVSFSIDNKEKAWKDAIKSKDLDREGWIHGSDLLGWGSPAARLLGVSAIPKIILIDPEGKAISFTLRGEELVRRVNQIMGGDLYYQN